MIHTKPLTQKQAQFIPKLIEWLSRYYNEWDLPQTLQRRDIEYYKSMLEKILVIGQYTLEEADLLTDLTTLYNDPNEP